MSAKAQLRPLLTKRAASGDPLEGVDLDAVIAEIERNNARRAAAEAKKREEATSAEVGEILRRKRQERGEFDAAQERIRQNKLDADENQYARGAYDATLADRQRLLVELERSRALRPQLEAAYQVLNSEINEFSSQVEAAKSSGNTARLRQLQTEQQNLLQRRERLGNALQLLQKRPEGDIQVEIADADADAREIRAKRKLPAPGTLPPVGRSSAERIAVGAPEVESPTPDAAAGEAMARADSAAAGGRLANMSRPRAGGGAPVADEFLHDQDSVAASMDTAGSPTKPTFLSSITGQAKDLGNSLVSGAKGVGNWAVNNKGKALGVGAGVAGLAGLLYYAMRDKKGKKKEEEEAPALPAPKVASAALALADRLRKSAAGITAADVGKPLDFTRPQPHLPQGTNVAGRPRTVLRAGVDQQAGTSDDLSSTGKPVGRGPVARKPAATQKTGAANNPGVNPLATAGIGAVGGGVSGAATGAVGGLALGTLAYLLRKAAGDRKATVGNTIGSGALLGLGLGGTAGAGYGAYKGYGVADTMNNLPNQS